jgi:protein TonB
MVEQDKTVATLHVDSLETIKTPNDSVFAPSADAMLLPTPTAVLSGVANAMLVTKVIPDYPIVAKQSHLQGTIIVAALIGKDGRIADLQVITGPTPLREAALDAVKQWVYWPYFVDGEAVQVATKINVVFSLGG